MPTEAGRSLAVLLLVIDRLREAPRREQNLRELLAASERTKGGD